MLPRKSPDLIRSPDGGGHGWGAEPVSTRAGLSASRRDGFDRPFGAWSHGPAALGWRRLSRRWAVWVMSASLGPGGKPITIPVSLALVGMIITGGGLIWHGSDQVATIRSQVQVTAERTAEIRAALEREVAQLQERNASQLAEVRMQERERTEAIGRRSVEMNQLQQQEIDRLRLAQGTSEVLAGRTDARLTAIEGLLNRIDQRLGGDRPQAPPR